MMQINAEIAETSTYTGAKQRKATMAAAHDRTKEWEALTHDIFMGREPQKYCVPEEDSYDTESTASDEFSDTIYTGFGYSSSPEYLAINLIEMSDQGHRDDDDDDNVDPYTDSWMKAALAMSASIDEVSFMIESKAASYLNCTDTFDLLFFGDDNNNNDNNNFAATQSTISNAERSILETTVASFAAGMAKQIESLRQTVVVEGDHYSFINSYTDDGVNYHEDGTTQRQKWANGPIGHRTGIAACLMQRLRSEIMDTMTELTSQLEKSQSRGGDYSIDEPNKIAQNPLLGFFSGVTLDVTEQSDHQAPPPPAPWELGDHDPEQERFEREQDQDEFLRIYGESSDNTQPSSLESLITNTFPPPSLLQMLDAPKLKSSTTQQSKLPIPNLPSPPNSVQQYQNVPIPSTQQYNEEQHIDQLQQESATILATYQHSDLEGVQKVERSMVEITQLLSRFTDLITEQQEDIFMIHDQAIKSKENVDKGQDQLVDAVNRGKKSTHPMATFIVFAGILLLLFNWITP